MARPQPLAMFCFQRAIVSQLQIASNAREGKEKCNGKLKNTFIIYKTNTIAGFVLKKD